MITILIGGGLRLYNLQWDNGTFPHPDERSTLLFYAPTIRFPEDMGDMLDTHKSPLNPFWEIGNQQRRSYTYGHFPLYLLVATCHLLTSLAPSLGSLGIVSPEIIEFFGQATTGIGYAVVGRAWVGLLDTLSIYFVFLIVRRMYGDWAGLLAASLSALAVLHIQLAHFFAVDPISTTFVLMTIYASILMLERRTVGTAILAGVGIGLAVSSKYSALPIALAPAMAGWLMMRGLSDSESKAHLSDSEENISESDETSVVSETTEILEVENVSESNIGTAIYLLIIAAIVSFLTFAITSPFVLLDYDNFNQSVVEEQGRMVSGVADFPFTRQYRNTTIYLYFIEQQIRWGLGITLGLLGFIGLAWAIGKGLINRLEPGGYIILAWIIPYFGATGLFLAKFMRYMSPVTPFVIIFGVGLLVTIAKHVSRSIAITIAMITLIGTGIWTASFVNGVYATEHSWVTASRWIYANIPDGSCIAREHWEEGVPMSWDEPGMSPGLHQYKQPQMPMYEADNQHKFEVMRNTLTNCDYLIIASNRMLRTLPRLAERYPMSTRYYQALFDGELGYELIAEFSTPPRLGDFVIDDQPADESFTVYDHPKAYIFKKERMLSGDEWLQIFEDTWNVAKHGYIGEPTLLMTLQGYDKTPSSHEKKRDPEATALKIPLRELPIVDDWQWNSLANADPYIATFVWWLAIEIIGLVAFPMTFFLFARLFDKGYLLSKTFGLLLVSYGVWLLASVGLPANRFAAVIAMLLLLSFINGTIFFRYWHQFKQWWQEQWKLVIVGELLFIAVFLFFVRLRMANPDLWQPWNGGEKMLEIGFLTAIVRSPFMPPFDPFFAGYQLNYYYYGMFIIGVLIKLTGIQPSIAFNLAVPMLAGLTAINVFSLVGNLAHVGRTSSTTKTIREGFSIGTGLLGVIFVLFLSNLDGMGQFLRNLAKISESTFRSAIPGLQTLVQAIDGFILAMQGNSIPEYNFWDPSRVIPNTINEFPYWSFLFADLHPHMIGIPFTVLFLALAYSWLKNSNSLIHQLPTLLRWLAIPFVLGALAVINTWDLPSYLGIITVTFMLFRYRTRYKAWRVKACFDMKKQAFSLQALMLIGETVIFAAAVLGITLLLYRPFFITYQPLEDVGIGLIKDKIPLDEFFKLWGWQLLMIFAWLWLELRYPRTMFAPLRAIGMFVKRWQVLPHLSEIYQRLVQKTDEGYRLVFSFMGLMIFLTIVLIVLKYYTVALLMPWLAIVIILLLRWDTSAEHNFIELLIFTGILILIGVQFVFIRDFLGGGDYYRMNTYFKFFVQVWVMFGIASAVIVANLWTDMTRWRWTWRMAWQILVVIFIFATSVFIVLGTPDRLDNRFPDTRPEGLTLDGMAYMTVGEFTWDNDRYELKYDYEALSWMQANIHGTPIIAEAKMGYYREWGMRVAAYTGLPSILGGLHQSEQHSAEALGKRDGIVREFWATMDLPRVIALIEELEIRYIYIGQLERGVYGDGVVQKFETLAEQDELEPVFSNDKTIIYRVP